MAYGSLLYLWRRCSDLRGFYMRLTLIIYVHFFMISCQSNYEVQSPYNYDKVKVDYFQQFVNPEKDDKNVLVNHSYPIEIKLLDNNKFEYLLDVLGGGEGTWGFEDGYLKLYAERKLFVMNMFLRKAESIEEPVLEFRDRFGPKFLEMERMR